MSETTVPPAAPKDMGLVARVIGIITAPRDTYAVVAAAPRWLGMAVLIILIVGGCQMWFQSTQIGKQATLDESVRRIESFGVKVSDEMYEQIRKPIMEPPAWRIGVSAAAMVVAPLVVWAVMAGLLFLVFGVFTGGRATFKQLYAVVVHSGVISTLGHAVPHAAQLLPGVALECDESRRVHAVPVREQFPRAAGRHGGFAARVVGNQPGDRRGRHVQEEDGGRWRSSCSACTR